jgi:hypothetical protein
MATKPTPRQLAGRKVLRAVAGALWSLPLRFVTIPAIAGAMLLAAGGTLTPADLLQWPVMLSGVGVSVALRLLDNLAVEFALFPALMRLIKRR